MNIATHEINFLNKNSEELIAQNGIIKKIVFHPRAGSGEVFAIFRNDLPLIDAYSKYKRLYIEELNQGKTQLLKISRKILVASDSVFGTRKKYAFHLEQSYFVRQNAKLHYLRKLNNKELLPLLYMEKEAETLIEKNNLNLAKEKDVLTLIEHLNKKTGNSVR